MSELPRQIYISEDNMNSLLYYVDCKKDRVFTKLAALSVLTAYMSHDSKFIADVKCVITLVSPLSFYKVSCFYIFPPLSKHSFEARLLGSSSLPMFVCMRWGTLVAFARACLSCGSSFGLLWQSLQPASLWRKKIGFCYS